MKLYRKSATCNNIVIFLISSIFYWYIIHSIQKEQSAFNLSRISHFAMENLPIVVLMTFTMLSIIRIKKWSIIPFVIYSGWISFECILIFMINFDKLILIFTFIYIICSFYFYLIWKMELNEVIYCPGYHLSNIGTKSEHHFETTVKFKNKELETGYLSNWGETCCFVVLNKKINFKNPSVLLEIAFEGKIFRQEGLIATGHGNGFGIKFVQKSHEDNGQNWASLYTIIKDRGYDPQDVRKL